MRHSHETKCDTFQRTDGRCHICRATLIFKLYGKLNVPGAWEIDHSNPLAVGGTHTRRNFLPACPGCNRSKQHRTTRSARAQHGYMRAPVSAQKQLQRRTNNTIVGGGIGAVALGVVAGPPGILFGVVLGGFLGNMEDVE
jgi:hypothetical protein